MVLKDSWNRVKESKKRKRKRKKKDKVRIKKKKRAAFFRDEEH